MSAPFNPDAPPDPRTRVKMGEQLWSTQVGMIEATAGEGACAKPEVAYEWSNGRVHYGKRNPYEPPAT